MKDYFALFEREKHKWLVCYHDPKNTQTIPTNEFFVIHNDQAILLDPGTVTGFPALLSTCVRFIDLENIKYIFSSHQDPDVSSSLSHWFGVQPDIKCLMSELWKTFLPHFGGLEENFVTIPDKGMTLDLNGLNLEIIPSHFLHSAGAFSIYDPEAKILFSGDIGASINDAKMQKSLFVDDFNEHIKRIEYFHKRWMPSNEFKLRWCEKVYQLDLDMICPQHGLIYYGDNVKRFIDWFYKLRIGDIAYKGSEI